MPSVLRRIFSRKTFVRLAWTIAALIALLVAAIAFENWRGDRAWAAYRAEADRRGVPYQRTAFLPPPVPDAENFAAIPIFQDIFAAHAEHREAPQPFRWPSGKLDGPPPCSDRHKGERLDLVKCRDRVVDARLLIQPTDNPARDILNGLATFETALQELRDAARRPGCYFPVQWEKGLLADTPHFDTFELVGRIHALRLTTHLALGDTPAALVEWRDVLAMHRALAHEPGLDSGVVRDGMLWQMEDAIWDGLAARQWAEPELRALMADFASLNLLADWRLALSSERSQMNGFVEDLVACSPGRRLSMFGIFMLPNGRITDPTLSQCLIGWLFPHGWFRQSQVKCNRYYDRHLAQIDPTQGRFAADAPGDEFRNYLIGGAMSYTPFIAAIIGADYTFAQQARTACALELFRRAHGTFPERLEELVPEFLDTVPRDVMDGAPLRYRRTAVGSFELWSIGSNRQDDGGITGPKLGWEGQLDWVWRY